MLTLCNIYFTESVCYREKQTKLFQKWESIRKALISARIEEMSPSSDICVLCSKHVENIVTCENCGPLAYYCDECCERIHRPMLFHKPKKWTVSIIL